MYGAVVDQGVLQMKWEAWRWGAQWLAIEVDNDQFRRSWEVAKKKKKRTQHWLFYGYSSFEANCKCEKPW